MAKQSQNQGLTIKQYIKLFVFLLLFAGFCIMAFFVLSGDPKTPKTSNEVFEILDSYGFEFVDMTERVNNELNDIKVKECVYFVKDDIRIIYYMFYDTTDATVCSENISAELFEIERGNRRSNAKAVSTFDKRANIRAHSMITDNTYYYNCKIGDTLIYVECKAKYASYINELVNELDYTAKR